MQARIEEIKKPFGMQPKKDGGMFGPATLVLCGLENGEQSTVWVFEDKQIGDSLDLEKNGQYWNVVSKKRSAETEKHEEIMKALRVISAQIKALGQALDSETVKHTTSVPKPAIDATTRVTPQSTDGLDDVHDFDKDYNDWVNQ